MRDVLGYEGLYAIEKDGRIWSYPREHNTRKMIRFYKGRWMLGTRRADGYVVVRLTKNRKEKSFFVHRLLAIMYIPNPNKFPDINHLDCNPSNNDLKNLEWCSTSRNVKYAYDTGRRANTSWSMRMRNKLGQFS